MRILPSAADPVTAGNKFLDLERQCTAAVLGLAVDDPVQRRPFAVDLQSYLGDGLAKTLGLQGLSEFIPPPTHR